MGRKPKKPQQDDQAPATEDQPLVATNANANDAGGDPDGAAVAARPTSYGAVESVAAASPTVAVASPCTGSASTELDPERRRAVSAIRIAMIFCFAFMIVEVIGGYVAHSLAILTDAAHLLTDIGAFALSLYTLHATTRGSDHTFSYGYHRAEVVGTLASVFTIWALVGAIVLEAAGRLKTMWDCAAVAVALPAAAKHGAHAAVAVAPGPECNAVKTETMIIVGILGLLVNLTCAAILSWGGSHGHSHGLGGGGHGHSHGGHDDHDDDHGHSHGGHDDDHGHSHGDHDDHGHSHGGHDDDHGHGHGGHADHDDHHGHSHGGGGKSMALNAAFLHALGDSVQSAGVILAGIFIYVMNSRELGHPTDAHSIYNMADPACSLLFAVVTLYTTKDLIRQLLGILMETTPDNVNYDSIRNELTSIAGVENVHDLHIWSLTADKASLSVHVVATDQKRVLAEAQRVCTRHGIDHTTIQVDPPEVGAEACVSKLGCHNC